MFTTMKRNPFQRALPGILCVFLLAACASGRRERLTEKQRAKIDPRLHFLVTSQDRSPAMEASPPQPKPVGYTEDGSPLYSVIVYTKDAESLKEAGIEVNSVLPGFVTARISGADLIRLARIDSVTAIKVPEMMTPDQK